MLKNYISKIGFACKHIIPLVFDDSLSYYETLCKINKKTNELVKQVNRNTDILDAIGDVETLIIDQTYQPQSTHAQSGTAVAEAIGEIDIPEVTVDETYNPNSSNAQSGKAVKQAIDSIEITPTGVVDQTYQPQSTNAQSGTAVAEAIKSYPYKITKNVTIEEQIYNESGYYTFEVITTKDIYDNYENLAFLVSFVEASSVLRISRRGNSTDGYEYYLTIKVNSNSTRESKCTIFIYEV